jgi:hypothetical protein
MSSRSEPSRKKKQGPSKSSKPSRKPRQRKQAQPFSRLAAPFQTPFSTLLKEEEPPTKRVASNQPAPERSDVAEKAATLISLSHGGGVPLFHSAFRGAFPETLTLELPYADHLRLTPSTSVSYYLYRATDVFDPDYTGTGHQPLGFDQYMQFYNHFVVLEAHCTVHFISESTEPASGAALVGLRLGASTTTYSTIQEFMEDPWSSWGYLQSSPFGHVKLERTFRSSDFYGLDRSTLVSSSTFWGSASASPAEEAYFQVAVFSQNPGTTDCVTLPVFVQIHYTALLTEPKLLAQS